MIVLIILRMSEMMVIGKLALVIWFYFFIEVMEPVGSAFVAWDAAIP